MTTKGLSRKQIIILISSDNISIIISQANKYISNMNKLLKNIKSDISANYIWSDNKDIIIITTNKTTTMSNINIIEKYIKDLNNINSNKVMSSYLSQSKSYLKILEILYYSNNLTSSIIYNQIKEVIKKSHLFNNTVLASWSYIINVSSKFNMTITWINI